MKPVQHQLQKIEVVREDDDLFGVLDGILEVGERLVYRRGIQARYRVVDNDHAFGDVEGLIPELNQEVDKGNSSLLALA